MRDKLPVGTVRIRDHADVLIYGCDLASNTSGRGADRGHRGALQLQCGCQR